MSSMDGATRPQGRLAPALPRAGQRLIVAGGCGGIGRSIVDEALALGLEVIVLDLQVSIDAHRPPPGVVACVGLNAGHELEVEAAFKTISARWRAIDALVNLVGFTRERIPIEDMSTEEWDSIVAGNLRSAFLISRAAAPGLRASAASGGQPAVVLTSSTFGVRVSRSGYGPYAASKAGVIGLCKALSAEWAPQVRVNCIAPGLIQTAFLTGGTGRAPKKTGLDQQEFLKTVPMGRLGEPLDITGPTLFLLSEAAGYITGQTLHVNGGSFQA